MFVLFAQYFLLAFVVIYATSKLGYFVDELDKKSNISGALLGGVLLATITSMPEFASSKSARTIAISGSTTCRRPQPVQHAAPRWRADGRFP